MCGISGVISNKQDREQDIKKVRDMSLKITHRGPDSKSIYPKDNFHLNFNRLSIVDIQNGNQLFYSKKKNIMAWVNGEIYNYREIKENYSINYNYQTRSDCEVVGLNESNRRL
jgi:asparagine synthase (glutamine-hydrolysing)